MIHLNSKRQQLGKTRSTQPARVFMKNRFNIFLSLLILVCSSIGMAQSFEELFEKDLEKMVRPFSGNIKLYNYFKVVETEPRLNSNEGRIAIAHEHLKLRMSRFWHSTQVDFTKTAGPGIYAAIDPYISREHGNVLNEITVNPKYNYIDLVNPIELSPETLVALEKEGLSPKNFGSPLNDTFLLWLPGEPQKFREAVTTVLKKLNVIAFEYGWDSYLPLICKEASRKSAFVFFGLQKLDGTIGIEPLQSKILKWPASDSMDQVTPNSADGINLKISFFKSLVTPDPNAANFDQTKINKSLEFSGFSYEQLEAMKSELHSCDKN